MQKESMASLKTIVKEYKYILIDAKVFSLYKDKLELPSSCLIVDEPESKKNIENFELLCGKLLDLNIKRNDKILAIGGGALSDLAGFVASSILRGIEWSIIPTTLLSMIDASIGGKVGINTSHGKNLIGSFHLPSKIYFNFEFLETLEKRDYNSGLGELIKYAFVNPRIFEKINSPIEELIFLCAKTKDEIVKTDLCDKGLREILNFGHTFGHAIEHNSNLSHGESVYYGIFLNLFLFSGELLDRFFILEKKLGLERESLNLDFNTFFNSLNFDKKNTSSSIAILKADGKTIGPKEFIEVEALKSKILKSSIYDSYFK